ncbi:unnamed protein product [Strongylus vulgaris]|uniref:Amine oxidase domain-containing protein n=1 Tax=Strongylus vulgaris TaxID=40348 RepID=A0A3P7K3D1_STRVU|nr:unnamed protein product [Strongylus vulgaris]
MHSLVIDEKRPTPITQVAIIGAGFAGLSAAAVLEKHSVNYVVYEGADRVGGRVYPFPYGSFRLT